MLDKHSRFYEFGKVRYYPQRRILTSLDGKKEINLSNQLQDFLLVLLSRAGKIASHEDIWAALWPDDRRSLEIPEEKETIKRSIAEAKLNLVKCLRAVGGDSKLIEPVHGEGYRLNARVRERREDEPPPQKAKRTPNQAVEVAQIPLSALAVAPPPLSDNLPGLMPADNAETGYVLAISGLYAALFVVALFLEIACAWGSYGVNAARLAPFVWLWMSGAMFGSLALAALLTRRNGLLWAVLWLALAQAALVGALSFFLPAFPVTESHLQAQTAFGAYFKNAFIYFLPLGVFLLLLPVHSVAVLRRALAEGRGGEVRPWLEGASLASAPGGVYLKPKWLAVALLLMAAPALALTQNLLGNLRPGPYQNLFTTLVWLRLLGYFVLGVTGLMWYEAAWRRCKKLAAAPRQYPVNQAPPTLGWRLRWVAGLAVWLLACGGGLAWGLQNAVMTPHIDWLKVLAPAAPGREFSVRIEGAAFDPQTVRLGVTGPGCQEEPCFVPNSALRKYGAVSDKVIENAPLTLAEGEFGIFLQHSNNAISNTVKLAVPASPGLLQSSLK